MTIVDRTEPYEPRTLERLRIADDDLRAVLEGRRHLLFDGGMGTMLQAAGLEAGARPELLCITDPESIRRIHAAYVAAGAEVVTTNTFGANALKLGDAASVEDVYAAAAGCARASGARYVAGDIGPLGTLLKPLGTMGFDEAYEHFSRCVRAAAAAGCDLLVIETMTDLAEIKAAVLAAKEQCDLPIFATMTFEPDGRTFLGTSPQIAAVTLDALGADVLGINCSLGPAELRPFAQAMLASTAKPVMVQANAGLPHVEDGCTVYDIGPEPYAAAVADMVADGVGVIGGCCGTNPSHIELLAGIVAGRVPAERPAVANLTATSAQSLVELPEGGRKVAVIGERINPTGKKRLQAALRAGEMGYIVGQAISQQEQGADVLDVNVGLPGIDEAAMIARVVEELSGATLLPLQIDSTDPAAIEAGVRAYAGKPIINSVNGKQEVLDAVLPLAAHYGCDVIGLTLDESGIPATAEGRVRIARRIVEEAARYGIGRERILIDCLVMTASTNQQQVAQILDAVGRCRRELGVHCTLGVSNVSFGLPARELLNATFLASALGAGLDAPILNPGSEQSMDVVRSYRVMNGEDAGSAAFIERYAGWQNPRPAQASTAAVGAAAGAAGTAAGAGGEASAASTEGSSPADALHRAVLTGRKSDVGDLVRALLADHGAMDVIDRVLIPALNEVGDRFDSGEFFLPQLMASAEAARAGFDAIRADMPAGQLADKGAIALATVKGDIHDIGKNIVKMLLENYGYRIYDLGRDVDPQAVLDIVRAENIPLVGLSALMTTTVASMEKTIALLKREAPGTKVFVGGAVLTSEYAHRIGADFYAKDAAESARIAERVFGA